MPTVGKQNADLWEDLPIILLPIITWLATFSAVGVIQGLLIAGVSTGAAFLLANYIRRWEKRVDSAVDRYVKEYSETPDKSRSFRSLQILCDAVGLTLQNNLELRAVRCRIRKRGLPDPANSKILKRGNLYKFLKFARKNNLPLDKPGSLAAATLRYKGLTED